MEDKNNALQGKTDAVEIRAAEIAKREGRDVVTDKDRKAAFDELREMGPPPDKTQN